MAEVKAVVPAREQPKAKDEFHYVKSQKLPDSILAGSNPMYQAKLQLQRFAPDASYERDAERSDEMFDVFKCPREAFLKMEKGLQAEANARTTRSDLSLKTAPGTEMLDKFTTSKQTLNELGAELPGSTTD